MPIEEQLLPHKDLARFYSRVTWLYVCRTFDKKPEKDRIALRAHDRFGISSWPQMFLFDPKDDRALATPPRKLMGFVATFDRVLEKWTPPGGEVLEAGRGVATELAAVRKLEKGGDPVARRKALTKLASRRDAFEGWLEARELLREGGAVGDSDPLVDPDPFVRAVGLEALALAGTSLREADRDRALALLRDPEEDIVVRIRALRLLGKAAPKQIADSAAAFLKVANDQWTYEVLNLVRSHPRPGDSAAVLELLAAVGRTHPSRNPNVIRIRALESLGSCGDEEALATVIGFLQGSLQNSLTRLTPRALAAMATRMPDTRGRVTAALIAALPASVEDPDAKAAQHAQRMATAMAREIAAAVGTITGQPAPKIPRTWSAVDRTTVERSLRSLL